MRLLFPRSASDALAEDLDDEALSRHYAPDRSRPGLRVNFVTSIDGAVEVGGYSEGLSGASDKAVFGLLRQHSDALLVGAGTVRHEGYRAVRGTEEGRAWREKQGLATYPTLVVVSASLDLDPSQGAFAQAPVRPVILTVAEAPLPRRRALEAVADVVTCGQGHVDLVAGLAELRSRGLAQVLSEGGPHLFGTLLAADLVDEVCLTISPLLAGPGAARIIAGPPRDATLGMRLIHIISAGDVLLTRYAREN